MDISAHTVAAITSWGVFSLPGDTPGRQATGELEAMAFDVAMVEGEGPARVVEHARLAAAFGETVAVCAREVRLEEVVDASAPMLEVGGRLATRPWFLVMRGGALSGIVTRADLERGPMRLAVLALLLDIEGALRRLVPSYTGGLWEELLGQQKRQEVSARHALLHRERVELHRIDCLTMSELARVALKAEALEADLVGLGWQPKTLKDSLGAMTEVRNALAHGRPWLVRASASAHRDVARRLERLGHWRRLARDLGRLIEDRPQVWEAYLGTRLRVKVDGVEVWWTGEGASALPGTGPIHGVTAWNPYEEVMTEEVNRGRQERLRRALVGRGVAFDVGWGESPDGRWREETFFVRGLGRQEAVALGGRFGQRAIFEVTSDDLQVVCCRTGMVRVRRPRRSAP